MDRSSANLKVFSQACLPYLNLISGRQVVKEFVGALWKRRTYNIFENWYCLFGFLWGIPVPVVTIGIDLHSSGLPITLPNIIQTILSRPFHIFFLLHPIFFGIVFGAMGTVRYNKEQRIEEFEKSLIGKNAELAQKNDRLRELDRLKSNFLSMVSHELRTPLTTIQGYISFLMTEKSGAINRAQRECLQISGESADLLNRLIEDLLDLSKIESGAFKVNLTAVNMANIIDKAVLARQLFADKQGVTLENNMPGGLPAIQADEERIFQVITNILENSIKFSQKGGKVAITASIRTDGKVLFCISDTGIGIPPDKIDKVFDKFYQVDSSRKRKYGGCGLGLAISKSIIGMHNGMIWVESDVGVGSKFFFELLSAR